MILVWRHLLESTVAASALTLLAWLLPGGRQRYFAYLAAAAKFAFPAALATGLGARLAAIWPPSASPLLQSLMHYLNSAFAAIGWFGSGATLGGSLAVGFAAFWVLGSTVAFASWVRAAKAAGETGRLADPGLTAIFDEVSSRMGVKNVQLRICLRNEMVLLRGIVRPILLLPRGLARALNDAELKAVFTHELAHARRRDNLSAALVHTVTCLFWFHPLLWIIERLLKRERECACDGEVLASGIDCGVYLGALAKVCLSSAGAAAGTSAMNASDLQVRLARFKVSQASFPMWLAPWLLAIVAPFTTVIFPIAGGYCEECVSHNAANTAPIERR